LQGKEYAELSQAIRDGRLDELPIAEPERLLLDYVETLTKHAYRITDEQVDSLRRAGWTDEQIAEATYDAALFNFFVRLADAFDIHPSPEFDAQGVPRVLTEGLDA
jgi:alkylhydroperoxidase family enzyme